MPGLPRSSAGRFPSALRAALGSVAFGVALLAHGPVHEQIAALDARLARSPNQPELLLERADWHRLDGNANRALADIEAAENLSPDMEAIGWLRGRLLLEQRKPIEAITNLNRWLARHPDHAGGLTARARAHAMASQLNAAALDFSRAISAAAPPDPDLYLERAQTLRQLGPGRFREALAGLDEGLSTLGPVVTLQLEAISLEEALQNTDAALKRLDSLLERSGRKETWFVRRAELLERAGRNSEAERSWKDAWAACAALPPSLRSTAAIQALEQRIHARRPSNEPPASVLAAMSSTGTPPTEPRTARTIPPPSR